MISYTFYKFTFSANFIWLYSRCHKPPSPIIIISNNIRMVTSIITTSSILFIHCAINCAQTSKHPQYVCALELINPLIFSLYTQPSRIDFESFQKKKKKTQNDIILYVYEESCTYLYKYIYTLCLCRYIIQKILLHGE